MLDLVKRYALTSVALVVLVALGVVALVVLDHQNYTKDLALRGDRFSADTVVVGLFAFLVAAVTAALAYPSYREWRSKVLGPKPELWVGRQEGDNFVRLEDGYFTGVTSGHPLRIKVTNRSKVSLEDGQVNLYIAFPDDRKVTVDFLPEESDGFKRFNGATFIGGPPEERTVLITRLKQFPASSVLFFEPKLRFGSTCTFVLYAMLTGSNLRPDRQRPYRWSLAVK
jgi:hypothetical protein